MFVLMSLNKIIALYLMFNMGKTLVKIQVADLTIMYLFFGFALTHMFTTQIKAAHQSQNLIYSVLSEFKMRLSFKLKVKNIALKFYNKIFDLF